MCEPQKFSFSGTYLTILYVTVFTFALMYAPQPLMPLMGESFKLGDSSISLIMTVVFMPLCVAPLFYGAVFHRVGVRTLLMVSIFCYCLAALPVCLAQNFNVALIGRLAQGLIIPAILTSLMAYVSDHYSGKELQKAMATYVAFTVIGSLFGRLASGLVANFLGWRIAIFVMMLMTLLSLLPLRKLKPDVTASFAKIRLKDFKAVVQVKGVKPAILIEFLNFFVFMGIANILPFRVIELSSGPVSPFFISLFYLTYLVGVAVSLLSSRIADYLGGVGKSIVFSLCAFTLVMPTILIHNVYGLFLGLSLICLFQFLEHSMAPGIVNRMSKGQDSGVINGICLSTYYGGGALGTYLPSYVYSTFGWEITIFFLCGILCMAMLTSFYLRRYI